MNYKLNEGTEMLKLEFSPFQIIRHHRGCKSVKCELIFRLSNFDKINLITLCWRIVYS